MVRKNCMQREIVWRHTLTVKFVLLREPLTRLRCNFTLQTGPLYPVVSHEFRQSIRAHPPIYFRLPFRCANNVVRARLSDGRVYRREVWLYATYTVSVTKGRNGFSFSIALHIVNPPHVVDSSKTNSWLHVYLRWNIGEAFQFISIKKRRDRMNLSCASLTMEYFVWIAANFKFLYFPKTGQIYILISQIEHIRHSIFTF